MMRISDSFRTAVAGITVHKNRSFLTILGIVIGITAIMAVMSIGQSAQELIVGQIQRFGPANVFVVPGRQPNGPNSAAGTILNDSLKEKDFKDLQKKENVPEAKAVVPYVFGYAAASFGSEIYDVMVIGSSEYVQKNFDLKVAEGRFFDVFETDQKARVAVIGNKVKEELFGSANPIGEKIKFKDQKFQIIGVLAAEGQGSFIDFNKAVIAPYTAVQQNVLGIKYFNRIIVEAESVEALPGVVRDIKTLLRNNHNIDDPEKDDFFIQTQESIADSVKTVTNILTVLLTAVAAISLIVGGVGIMNIMLVSVTERTREIGLRKALGATNGNILTQFLFEAVFLTAIGGVFGVIGGTLLTYLLAYVANKFAGLNFSYIFSVSGAIWGIAVSFVIGLVFGIFPARKAAKKSPIESLRFE
ncbi:MAG TPA: ABC transporter permease [Candidatus Paceibacterota bacterium]|nr:ABC transporter permease [Candidatus Paceibacterota bacterium]